MPAIAIKVICRCCHQHIAHLRRRCPHLNRRQQSAFRTIGIPHLNHIAEPLLNTRERQFLCLQRRKNNPRRRITRLARHMQQPLIQRQNLILFPQLRHHIGHTRQNRQRWPPPLTPPQRTIPRANLCNLIPIHPLTPKRDHRLGNHQINILLQTLTQPPLPMSHRIGMRGMHIDINFTILHIHRITANIIRKRIKRTPTHQIKPRVMPMANNQPIVNRPLTQRIPHMRAPVIHRPNFAI